MKRIHVVPIDVGLMRPYGSIFWPDAADGGTVLGDGNLRFRPDRLTVPGFKDHHFEMSPCDFGHRGLVVDALEYHNFTHELVIAMTPIVIHLGAPLAGTGWEVWEPDGIEAFLVPAGAAMILKPRVIHHGPFAVKEGNRGRTWVGLPAGAYANDCESLMLEGDGRLQLVLPN